MDELHLALVGISTGVALHKMMEPVNILHKLRRLDVAQRTGKVGPTMMQGIDSRPKAYVLGLFGLSLLSAIAFFIARVVNPSVESAIYYAIGITLISEIVLMVRIDAYHAEIEKITRRQKK